MDDFLVRAFAGGIGIALAAGPLGCFVVWRRMAYFGATLAHSALLGVALGMLIGVDPTIGVVTTCVAVAVVLAAIEHRRSLPIDTVLGVLAHISLAAGLVLIAFMPELRVDLMAYLFGDILAIGATDLWIIIGVACVSLIILAARWRALLEITVSEDLAAVDGIDVAQTKLVLVVLLAVVVGIGMKIVGMLLVVSMLLIPPAAARGFARTPEAMAVGATLVGVVSVALGLVSSLTWDVPSGPMIVLAAAALLGLGQLWRGLRGAD